jgi:hypothetical protein
MVIAFKDISFGQSQGSRSPGDHGHPASEKTWPPEQAFRSIDPHPISQFPPSPAPPLK